MSGVRPARGHLHLRGLITGMIAAGIAFSLVGCFADPERDRQRVAFLQAAVADVDPGSFGDVVCDVSGGETGLGKGFHRWILLAGTESWEAVGFRFEELGYNGVTVDDSFTYARPDGILATGSRITSPGSYPAAERAMDQIDCTVPKEGGIVLYIEEVPDSGPEGAGSPTTVYQTSTALATDNYEDRHEHGPGQHVSEGGLPERREKSTDREAEAAQCQDDADESPLRNDHSVLALS